MFNYRPFAAAFALAITGLTACKPSRPDAAEFAALDRIEASHSIRSISDQQSALFADDIMSLDNVKLSEGASGLRVSAICKLLAIKGFSIADDTILGKDSLAALSLINAAIGNKDTSDITVNTLQAVATLPNSTSFSLFSLASKTSAEIADSYNFAPKVIQLSDRQVPFREALQLATPVFDEIRRGESIPLAEFKKLAEKSDHHLAALELIKFSLTKADENQLAQLTEISDAFKDNKKSVLLDARCLASCEEIFPAMMDDWQSYGGGGISIKTIYLQVSRQSRQEGGQLEFAGIINHCLGQHFGKLIAHEEANTENIFRSFF